MVIIRKTGKSTQKHDLERNHIIISSLAAERDAEYIFTHIKKDGFRVISSEQERFSFAYLWIGLDENKL